MSSDRKEFFVCVVCMQFRDGFVTYEETVK